jgi:hypothetical protein
LDLGNFGDNYQRIKEFNLKYYFIFSQSEKIIIGVASIINGVALYLYYRYGGNFLYFFYFFTCSMFFAFFIYKMLLLTPFKRIKIYKKKSNINLIEFKQSQYLSPKKYFPKQELNKYIQNTFLVSWMGKNIREDELKRAIYFSVLERYHKYKKEYKRHDYIAGYIIKSFLFTAIAFHGLIVFLTNININLENQNIIFLFVLSYIIFIITISYFPYIDEEQELFFKRFIDIKDFNRDYLLIDDNLDRTSKREFTTDVLAIVFGVLFGLYIGIAFNIIYTSDVKLKYISPNIYDSSLEKNSSFYYVEKQYIIK